MLGTLVTPIPVTLNGKTHTATISLADVAWTSTPTDNQLQMQLTTSASAFWNFTSFGTINITNGPSACRSSLRATPFRCLSRLSTAATFGPPLTCGGPKLLQPMSIA